MTFPQTKLDVWAQLQIGGTWTDVSGDVRSAGGRDAITITRGISASGGVVADRGTCSLTLDNNSGAYSNRNPLSPYFPYLGLNTPIRVGAAYGTPWLDVPYGSVNTASTPDASVLDITGDLDIRVDAELAVWGDAIDTTAGTTELMGKYNITGNQRSWRLLVRSTQCLELTWSADGATGVTVQSVPLGVPPGSRLSVRATLDVNNGASGNTVTFYTSTTAGTSGPWTQLGAPVVTAGTTSIFNSTAALNVGDIPNITFGNLARKIYKAEVRSGIAGTIVANPDFEAQTVGATSFADTAPSPRTWTVTAGAITNRYLRFSGEVSEWPPQWDTGGLDVTTPIQASGRLQRAAQSRTVIQSAMRRSVTAAAPLYYWPMEDGAAATQAASGLLGGAPMQVVGVPPQFGSTDGPPGSLPLPNFSSEGSPDPTKAGGLRATLASGSAASWTIEALMQFPTTLPLGFVSAIGWNAAGAMANVWEIDAQALADGGLSVQWADNAFANFGGPYYSNVNVTDGLWHHVRVTVAQSGTAISIQMWLDGTRVVNATEPSITLGAVTSINANPGNATDAGVPSMGHLAIWSPSTTAATYLAMNGNDGETACARVARIATEQNAPVSIAAVDTDTEFVGPQPIDTFLNVITAAAQADEGLLYETRERLGIRFRGRRTLYNQPSALDLPYSAIPQPLMAPLTPIGDLLGIINDSTVARTNGSSGRVQVTEGRLSVQEPPGGIGTGYDESITLNLHSDAQTVPHAGWRTHLGTPDADRFPQVNIELAKDPALIRAVCRIDTGSRMRIIPPLLDQLAPITIDQLVLGYTETLAQFSWRFSFACAPAVGWTVGVRDDAVQGRRDTSGSTLGTSVNSTATSLSVATGSGMLWTTNAADFPFDLLIGGEIVTATACTGSSSPQTMTVTRSVNGISKSQTAGTDIRLAQPTIRGL